jgi:hypothetical protein
MMERDAARMREVAESMLGWPFKPLGRDVNGIDCLGVMIRFHREAFSVEVPDPATFEHEEVLTHRMMDHFVPVPQPLDGDVVRIGDRHLAIRLGIHGLHVDESKGVVMIRLPIGSRFYRHVALC